MQHTFFQRVIMTLVAGFAAACLVWVYRHVVERSRYEMNEGWRDSFEKPAEVRR